MNTFKISTIIISLLFFINLPLTAEKIYCKKYTGTFKDYKLSVMFSQNGKMLTEVEDNNGGGYFSTPGSYTYKNSKIDYIYKGLMRTIYIEKDILKATPFTFDIEEDYKTEILLIEDKSYTSVCK